MSVRSMRTATTSNSSPMPGRAYVEGYRLQLDLPTNTPIPKSVATKTVRGEQRSFNTTTRRYGVNCIRSKATTQLEAVVETTANVTRGSVGGGEDLLTPNPVVQILEVSQGATVFQDSVDYMHSGNYVDWLGTANQPAIGTTYTVRWTYTKQMIKGTDYVDGGWFGQPNHPAPGNYHYFVTAYNAQGETIFNASKVLSRETAAGEINNITWLPVNGALGYRVYRSSASTTNRTDFQRLKDVGSAVVSYKDDAVDPTSATNPAGHECHHPGYVPLHVGAEQFSTSSTLAAQSLGDQPVNGSNVSVDYDYYVGRKDIIYATRNEIKLLMGAPTDTPKLPITFAGTLALCSVDCPPNSTNLTVQNYGLTRVTMDMIHDIMEDVEALKYNDAQYQMNNALQNRDAQTKKGIYSDDFSNDSQSDIYHVDWSARINADEKYVAPARAAASKLLEVDLAKSNVRLHRQPRASSRDRNSARRAERLVGRKEHQPVRRVRQAAGDDRGYSQYWPARPDRHCCSGT